MDNLPFQLLLNVLRYIPGNRYILTSKTFHEAYIILRGRYLRVNYGKLSQVANLFLGQFSLSLHRSLEDTSYKYAKNTIIQGLIAQRQTAEIFRLIGNDKILLTNNNRLLQLYGQQEIIIGSEWTPTGFFDSSFATGDRYEYVRVRADALEYPMKVSTPLFLTIVLRDDISFYDSLITDMYSIGNYRGLRRSSPDYTFGQIAESVSPTENDDLEKPAIIRGLFKAMNGEHQLLSKSLESSVDDDFGIVILRYIMSYLLLEEGVGHASEVMDAFRKLGGFTRISVDVVNRNFRTRVHGAEFYMIFKNNHPEKFAILEPLLLQLFRYDTVSFSSDEIALDEITMEEFPMVSEDWYFGDENTYAWFRHQEYTDNPHIAMRIAERLEPGELIRFLSGHEGGDGSHVIPIISTTSETYSYFTAFLVKYLQLKSGMNYRIVNIGVDPDADDADEELSMIMALSLEG